MYNNHKLHEVVTFLVNVLFTYLFIDLACSVFDLYYLFSLKDKGFLSNGGLEAYWETKENVLNFCSRLMPISVGLVFIVWIYREYWNTQSLFNQYEFKFKPIMGVLGFIIPVFNIYAPIIIMKEIIRGYNAYYDKNINEIYVNIWWLGYLVFSTYRKMISLKQFNLVNDNFDYAYHQIISTSIGLVSLFFLILILKQLSPNYLRHYQE